jgi:hypothetical protein
MHAVDNHERFGRWAGADITVHDDRRATLTLSLRYGLSAIVTSDASAPRAIHPDQPITVRNDKRATLSVAQRGPEVGRAQ